MARILGIDPGSVKTGFGIINVVGGRHEYVTSGVIRLPKGALPERLRVIHESVSQIIGDYQPELAVVEEVFMAHNPSSALKLGQARGAAIVACVSQGLEVSEFTARQIKQAVVGSGGADKLQVQHMVKTLLKLPAAPQEDAADALAAALCYAHSRQSLINMAGAKHQIRGRMRRGRLG